jgi:CelD/BcsL family acetyltransferase involved in cellulose biosynthesis
VISPVPDRGTILPEGQRVRLFQNPQDCQAAWQTLLESGWSAPYQTPCWVSAWLEGVRANGKYQPCFVLLEEAGGSPLCLFPLVISGRSNIRMAEFCGQKHANFHVGIFNRQKSRPDAKVLDAMFRAAAQRAGIDCYSFFNQPFEWQGEPNPLSALPHALSANHAYKIDLQEDDEALISSLMSGETRKKLRNKEKRLSELGEVRLSKAASDQERAVLLNAFQKQKAERFAQLGIHNPFAEPEVETFLAAAIRRAPSGHVPVEIYALLAGERISAVIGVAEHGGRASGMFLSYDASPEIARFSPGDQLLNKLVRHYCHQKMSVFDLGTGDAEYKKTYCPTVEVLFDSVLSITAKGRAASLGIKLVRRARYTLKKQPMAIALYARLKSFRSPR